MSNTIKAALLHASAQLKALSAEPESSAFEAQLFLQQVLKVNRAWLIAHADDVLDAEPYKAFEDLLARRLAGEPVAYILGEREFFGLKLKVTPDTLIPRPDTETLVEAALAKIPNNNTEFKVLDLGTGTGAIALAIASERSLSKITALDASSAALKVAQENALTLKINNVQFVLSDWFSALSGQKFDVIVSNPPYIEQDDIHLSQGDVRFEPLSALASGQDGLDDIRHIIQHAPHYLKPSGWLMFEHGYNQAQQVAALLNDAGFSEIAYALDLAGIQRATFGRL